MRSWFFFLSRSVDASVVLIYARRVFFSTFHRGRHRARRRWFPNEYFCSSARRLAYPAKTRFSHSRCVSDAYRNIFIYIQIEYTYLKRIGHGSSRDTNNTGRRSDAPLCVGIHLLYLYNIILYSIIPFIYPSSSSSHHRDGDGNATDDRRSIAEWRKNYRKKLFDRRPLYCTYDTFGYGNAADPVLNFVIIIIIIVFFFETDLLRRHLWWCDCLCGECGGSWGRGEKLDRYNIRRVNYAKSNIKKGMFTTCVCFSSVLGCGDRLLPITIIIIIYYL